MFSTRWLPDIKLSGSFLFTQIGHRGQCTLRDMPGVGGWNVAKKWAEKFYASKVWKDTRKIVLRRDLYTCADCYNRASEVHHIVELTPLNINDVSISLNPDNLKSLCHDCHIKITLGLGDITEGFYFDDNGDVVKR